MGGELLQQKLKIAKGTRWMISPALAAAVTLWFALQAVSQNVSAPAADSALEKLFQLRCAGCHGENAGGGERAPALANSRSLRSRTESQIHDLIRDGTAGGMPPFPLPESELQPLARWVRSLNSSAYDMHPAGDVAAGEQFFFGKGQCSTCHMVHGRGKANGPDLSDIGRQSKVGEIEAVLDNPTSQMGAHSTPSCPAWAFCPDESWSVVNVRLRDGSSLRGFARNHGARDLQLQTFDGRMHLLTDADYREVSRESASYMPPLQATADERRNLLAYLSTLDGSVTGALTGDREPIPPEAVQAILHPKPGEWPAHNGVPGGNRYSPLDSIDTRNAGRLQLQWVYGLRHFDLEMTPLVSDGVMYITAPGQACALDARTGSEIWCHSQPAGGPPAGGGNRQAGGAANAFGQQPNRGAALLGDRVFFATDDAHLVCLNRLTGALMWDVAMAETPGRYSATSAPLVVGDLVVSGMSGGDGPLRGFLAAYKATSGQQAWRFWTIPKPGEPGSETWNGKAIETGGGATWVTGSYDVETGTLYWAVGNPFPATDGDDREGVNLYTNCVLALDARTGKLRWYYQFTPHDLHDWDATEPLVLVDTRYRGRDRKLLLQANRNGFFYVLDRTTGELLLARPFAKKLNWASAIGPDGKPQLLPANRPTKAGTRTCPAVRGATNWYSTSFNPESRLFYVMAVEDCSVYRQSQRGGYEGYRDPSDPGKKYLRAIDIETGRIVWEIEQVGPPESNYSGVLSTAGGLVFYGETGGGFAAVDGRSGRPLWSFRGNEAWRASPMTYMLNGRQYVAVTSGASVLSFALADR
jgi:PQQ-dependent dehydrogenase (methanol/ethanol family)